MDLKNKIVIGGVTYLPVPDKPFESCGVCDLYTTCCTFSGTPCELFPDKVHFVRQSDKKAYISLPISGQETYDIRRNLRLGRNYLHTKAYTVVTPYDASPNASASYAEHMGKDIQALLECDVVLMMPGWEQSKGCQCEKATAEIYGKEIIYYADTE